MGSWVNAFLQPGTYPHPVTLPIECCETHLSWVFLAGEYAYKIKKPVNFGFVDFSTPQKREHYLMLEKALNARFSPHIYREVLPIQRTDNGHTVGGDPNTAVDWVLQMRRFDETQVLDRLAAEGPLASPLVDALADESARIHALIDAADTQSVHGLPDQLHYPVQDNFRHCLELTAEPAHHGRLALLRDHVQAKFKDLKSTFETRKAQGFVRAVHGDMHLGNVVLQDGKPVFFDCIEFNESFRWTDTMADVGFMFMDLLRFGHTDNAYRYLNRYLEVTGDYGGLSVLNYYAAYRAMVRAKISLLTFDAHHDPTHIADFEAYLSLAEQLMRRKTPYLDITYGLSGTGKSTRALARAVQDGAIRIRSDVERKRMHHLAVYQPSPLSARDDLYSEQSTAATYERLLSLSDGILRAGWPVVVDAVFARRSEREQFQALALQLRVLYRILSFQVSLTTIAQRIEARTDQTSDADFEVVKAQVKRMEPLRGKEREAEEPQ